MRRITKSSEPSSFAAYRRTEGAAFEDMPRNVKDDLRKSLIKEQGGLCCYCMRRVPEEDTKHPGVKIEHFKCQDHNKDEQLLYRNLFAACWGGEIDKDESKHTCDTRKRNTSILSFDLLTSDFERSIRYLEDGTIQANTDAIEDEMNNVLGLNNQSLRSRREAVRSAVSSTLKRLNARGKKVTEGVIQNLIHSYTSLDSQGCYSEFFPVVVYYMKNKMKQFK